MTPPAEYPDLQGLTTDYDEILATAHADIRTAYFATTDDANLGAVLADNFVSAMNLARALGLLFDARNSEGANVVFRAFYETCVNFIYLHDVGDRVRNALLARAYALQEIAENHAAASDHIVATEHRRLFESMPKAIRHELAKNRKKERHHWSGVGLATRAERIGFVGHRIMYRGVSWDAHALALGRLPMKQIGEDHHELTMHRRLSDKDANTLARVARSLLRAVWARFSRDLTGALRPCRLRRRRRHPTRSPEGRRSPSAPAVCMA